MSAMSIDESSPGTTDASGTYQLMAGTSMSTPMVAGTVALILEKNPTLRQEQIRLGLQATARNIASGDVVDLAPGRYVRLTLADSGNGMDAATLARAAGARPPARRPE